MGSTQEGAEGDTAAGGKEGLGLCPQLWWRQLVRPSHEHGENSMGNTSLGMCLSLRSPRPLGFQTRF